MEDQSPIWQKVHIIQSQISCCLIGSRNLQNITQVWRLQSCHPLLETYYRNYLYSYLHPVDHPNVTISSYSIESSVTLLKRTPTVQGPWYRFLINFWSDLKKRTQDLLLPLYSLICACICYGVCKRVTLSLVFVFPCAVDSIQWKSTKRGWTVSYLMSSCCSLPRLVSFSFALVPSQRTLETQTSTWSLVIPSDTCTFIPFSMKKMYSRLLS